MRKIVVLGGGLYNRKIFEKLRDENFFTICVDRNIDAPSKNLSNQFFPIDIVDKEKILVLCRDHSVDGIMAINDIGTRTASYVSLKLGLPGLPMATVIAANDKSLMREVWENSRVAQPRYHVFSRLDDAYSLAKEIGFPCIMKPAESGGGGRGVSVLKGLSDVEWAYDFASPHVRTQKFIIEEYLDGTELTVETFSIDNCVHILAMSDKYKPELRTRVATSLNYPALLPIQTIENVSKIVTEAVQALGIRNGLAHTEVIITKEGPMLVELGARGGGGHIFHTIIEAVSGFNAPVETAKFLTGLHVEPPKILKRGAVYRFFNPPQGVLQKVLIPRNIMATPGVLDFGIVKKEGEIVGDLKNSLERAGYVVTAGKTREDAIKVADSVEKMIKFVVTPTSSTNL